METREIQQPAPPSLRVSFPGGKRVDAEWGSRVIRTDQSVAHGGNGTAPEPFDLFLASLAYIPVAGTVANSTTAYSTSFRITNLAAHRQLVRADWIASNGGGSQEGAQLLPVSRDAFAGTLVLQDLTEVYIRVGEHDAAVDQLDYLLSIPSPVSSGLLRVDPLYTPLRGNPRFERLVQQN